jgi:hypothetical protein
MSHFSEISRDWVFSGLSGENGIGQCFGADCGAHLVGAPRPTTSTGRRRRRALRVRVSRVTT